MITAPGIYADIPRAAYHADPCVEPSLSASLIKKLCLESAAHAHYAHPRLNPAAVEENGEHFDIGTAAHALLLEGSKAIAVIDAKDYRTNAAKEARDLAYAADLTPLLVARWTDVQAMVAAARVQLARHTDGGAAMFTDGRPEQTLIWQEEDVWCRARLDWLREGMPGPSIDDYKTTSASANPDDWTRSLFFSGTDIQVAWYLRGLRALTEQDGVFRFAVQETYPPYALAVIGLGPDALMLAEKKCLYALEKWREARDRNDWQGYPRRTAWASLPMAHEAWWLEKELR
jgi:hypothetical protein